MARELMDAASIAWLNERAAALLAEWRAGWPGMTAWDACVAAATQAELRVVVQACEAAIVADPQGRICNVRSEGAEHDGLGPGGIGFDDDVSWYELHGGKVAR